MLSLVDNRRFCRLSYRVLDHDATVQDVAAFLADLKKELEARGLALHGITTDGSHLYPQAIRQVFPKVRHQLCRFHVIKELTRAVLHAVSHVRKQLTAGLPALPRGRPSKAQRRRAASVERRRRRITELFEQRHLFVTRELSDAQRRTLRRITRGLPQLRRLREIMEQVYRLFDRRCRAKPPWKSSPSSADACGVSRKSAKRSSGCSVPIWRRPSRSWTTSYCPPPPTPWNAATAATAKCTKASTASAPAKASADASPWICCEKRRRWDDPKPPRPCTPPAPPADDEFQQIWLQRCYSVEMSHFFDPRK